MSIKNIFITACYEVENRYGSTEKNDYKKLTWLCCDSFLKNLVDIDEVIVLTGKKQNYHRMFEEIYWRIRDIHHRKPCNILWSDSDNLCLKPIKIFNEWAKFSMFLIADQYRTAWINPECKRLAEPLNPWMLANIRYYPAMIPAWIWTEADRIAKNWIDDWAFECIVHNKMFHSQEISDFMEYHIPKMNIQAEGNLDSITQELVDEAVIIHCHSTRGSELALNKMEKVSCLSA